MRRLLVLTATTAMLLASAGPANAAARDGGDCSIASHYLLTVHRLTATTLRVRFRITDSPRGDSWQVFGSDDGSRIFAVERRASHDGSVSVGKTIEDRPGRDSIKAAAYDMASGETCKGSVAL